MLLMLLLMLLLLLLLMLMLMLMLLLLLLLMLMLLLMTRVRAFPRDDASCCLRGHLRSDALVVNATRDRLTPSEIGLNDARTDGRKER